MKDAIPFDELYNLYKNARHIDGCYADKMNEVQWDDIVNLTPAELIKIPIDWLYDWCHITAHYELQNKIPRLYERFHLPIYTIKQYLAYFEPHKNA